MTLPREKILLSNARDLRKQMTKEERHLWYDFLRSHPMKFYKQKIIGRYIVDFYCHSAQLAIELDGSQHYEDAGAAYDKERTAMLEQHGVKVIRFSNLDVNRNFEGVCQAIELALKEQREGTPLSQLR